MALAVDLGGRRVFVSGYSPGPGSGTDYVTIAYDAATGARLRLSRYDGPVSGNDYAYDVAVSPDGGKVFVTGSSQGGPAASRGDYATVAYDAATGAPLWASRYSGPGASEDIATSLATGARRWVRRHPGAGIALAVSPVTGTVFVTGVTDRAASFRDYTTIAYHG